MATSLSDASPPETMLFREGTGRGLQVCPGLLSLSSLPCHNPLSTLALGCPHSCILAPNLPAKRLSLCVSTPSLSALQASGLLYPEEAPNLLFLLLMGTTGKQILRSQSSGGLLELPRWRIVFSCDPVIPLPPPCPRPSTIWSQGCLSGWMEHKESPCLGYNGGAGQGKTEAL